jgi:uroporphyrin-III C-methyltransferase
LVPPAILALASHARRLSVGKRHGRHSVSQDTINRLLVRGGRRKQRVVRLKAGDPYVFGRGGEEALALAAAGIPFEVVPGVSSAIAAPALAGIPVTHRGTASAFAVLAGHAPASYAPVLDAIAPGAMTLVFLMAIARQRDIAAALLARGWRGSTPVALLFAASRDDAETWTGTIASLDQGDGMIEVERPGMIVVGDVVNVRAQLQFGASAGTESQIAEAVR